MHTWTDLVKAPLRLQLYPPCVLASGEVPKPFLHVSSIFENPHFSLPCRCVASPLKPWDFLQTLKNSLCERNIVEGFGELTSP